MNPQMAAAMIAAQKLRVANPQQAMLAMQPGGVKSQMQPGMQLGMQPSMRAMTPEQQMLARQRAGGMKPINSGKSRRPPPAQMSAPAAAPMAPTPVVLGPVLGSDR